MDYIFSFQAARGVFSLPCESVDQYINEASLNDLKLLLYIYRSQGTSVSRERLAEALGLSDAEIEKSLSYWASKNLFSYHPGTKEGTDSIQVSRVQEAKTPRPGSTVAAPAQYSAEEISERAEASPELKFLLNTVPNLFGKLLSPSDCSTLIWLYEGVGLPADVILMLMEYCVSSGHPYMRYIEKMAMTWADDGINTHELAENKILQLENRRDFEGQIRSIMGISGRALTAAEKQHIGRWTGEWHMAPELVKLAYEICVNRTGKLSFSYINSILRAWHEKGFSTEQQARGEAGGSKAARPSYDIDEYVKLSMKRLLDD